MKYFILILLVACALTITSKQSVVTASTGADSHKERALVTFKTPVKLMDVLLKGEYMFVHDDQAMAAGDACTYVYKLGPGARMELVCSFHCIPVNRPKANSFTTRTSPVASNSTLSELTEIQFAGSREGHQVPVKNEARSEVVDVFGSDP